MGGGHSAVSNPNLRRLSEAREPRGMIAGGRIDRSG